ncbi:MAG TPA: hypothetical protein VNQ76_19060 [Planctomicrobium sp.]|nr:hypothetical protein [Planctomicrobium sp.]
MNFSLCRRPWLRVAKYLEQQYQRMQSRPPDQTTLSDEIWDRVQQLQYRLQLANRSRFIAAQTHLRRQLSQTLRRLAKDCLYQAEDLERHESQPEVPTLRLLLEELQSLQDEFDQVDIDWLTKILRVRTERIILEEIDLGPFEIRLSLDQLGCYQPYQVIALDPCRPGCCDDVTHPHVQSDTLCEGDGRHPIARALEQGRLGEFFLLVAQILRTYNSGSAYCRLSDWNGSPCADCGDTVNEEDQYTCDRCSSRMCDRCTSSCTCCDETLCNECSSTCESCQCTACDHCLSHCDSCNESICSGCLNDDLCPTCFEDSQENNDEETDHEEATSESAPAATTAPEAPTTTPDPAVQPDCLGETLVPE